MRKKKLLSALISIMTVIVLAFTVSFTAFATDEFVETYEPEVSVETEYYEPEIATEPETEPEYIETEPVHEETEPVEQSAEVETTQVDNNNNNNLIDELPQVESYEVVVPTTVKLPDIEVSDTSLMGGVIAWLCVALGIAVIAGVLVSQRTRQVGSGNVQSNRRR